MLALILGGARSVWDDAAAAEVLLAGRPRMVVACNFAGLTYPGALDAWVSLHPDMFSDKRRAPAIERAARQFGHLATPGLPRLEIHPERWAGSSGLYGVQIALGPLGCSGAILCGVPITREAGHIHWPGPWSEVDRYRSGFRAAAREIAPALRSMSGWTRDEFGAPTPDWLNERASAQA